LSFLNAATEKPSQHHETASPKNQNAVSLGQVSPTAWPFLLAARLGRELREEAAKVECNRHRTKKVQLSCD
jgi:hypothetical protein